MRHLLLGALGNWDRKRAVRGLRPWWDERDKRRLGHQCHGRMQERPGVSVLHGRRSMSVSRVPECPRTFRSCVGARLSAVPSNAVGVQPRRTGQGSHHLTSDRVRFRKRTARFICMLDPQRKTAFYHGSDLCHATLLANQDCAYPFASDKSHLLGYACLFRQYFRKKPVELSPSRIAGCQELPSRPIPVYTEMNPHLRRAHL